MAGMIYVIGIGPGSPDYVLPIAMKIISSVPALAGSSRALQTFAECSQETYSIGGKIEDTLNWLEMKVQMKDVAVLVSGDPGYYSLLVALRRRFSAENLKVIPGISSVQLAFARIAEVWQDAELVSLHGRQAAEDFWPYRQGRKVAFLTDRHNCPSVIAACLLKAGWPSETKVWLCERLSYDDEKIAALSLAETEKVKGFEACVMVVKG